MKWPTCSLVFNNKLIFNTLENKIRCYEDISKYRHVIILLFFWEFDSLSHDHFRDKLI